MTVFGDRFIYLLIYLLIYCSYALTEVRGQLSWVGFPHFGFQGSHSDH